MNNTTRSSGPATAIAALEIILRHGRIDSFPLFGLLSIAFAGEPVRCTLALALAVGALLSAHRERARTEDEDDGR